MNVALNEFFEIYHESFSRETREDDAQILEELKGTYRLPIKIRLWADERGVKGIARYTYLSETSAFWLIHIAVAAEFRGEGLGSEILSELLVDLKLPILAEVEALSHSLGWYHRFGFQSVCEGYLQPALHPDTTDVPLILMTSERITDRRSTLVEFYRRAWNLDEHHELVKRALDSM